MAYSLGWPVIPQMVVRRERWPGGSTIKGTPLVYVGQEVVPDQPILHIERAEVVEAVQPAPRLALPSTTANIDLRAIQAGLAARVTHGIQSEMLPAGLHGQVVEITGRGGVVIETRAAVVQGVIGAGNQVVGLLTMWYAGGGTGRGPQTIPPGAILVIPGPLNFSMLRQATHSGVVGIIASSIMRRDLEGFLAADLVDVVDCQNIDQMQARLPALTLLLTEGLGAVAMSTRTMNLLSKYQGSIVLLSGVTAVRQGLFPELIISLPTEEAQQNWKPVQPDLSLLPGAHVRICSGEHEGTIGVIDYLFTHQQVFASGVRARAARLRLEDGAAVVVPMASIERIG